MYGKGSKRWSLDCQSDQQNIASGYYSGGTLFGDGDLVSSNVRGGVEIFNTTGSYCSHFFGSSFIGGNCIWTSVLPALPCVLPWTHMPVYVMT